MPKMTAAIDASPDVMPITSVGDNPRLAGFFGTNISLPGFTSGWLLKNINFRAGIQHISIHPHYLLLFRDAQNVAVVNHQVDARTRLFQYAFKVYSHIIIPLLDIGVAGGVIVALF